MSRYAMAEQSGPSEIGRREDMNTRSSVDNRTPQVREQLDYLGKAVEILSHDVQGLLAKISPVQRQEPVREIKDVSLKGTNPSSPVASEICSLVLRIEAISRDVREGSDLLEV